MTGNRTPTQVVATTTMDDLNNRVRNGQLTRVQVQLAASLGAPAALALGLPRLRLRRRFVEWLVDVHRGLPAELRRVLKSVNRSTDYALPPRLSVLWAARCAERTLVVFEEQVPGDSRPRQAVELAHRWALDGGSLVKLSDAVSAANAANASVATARESAAIDDGLQVIILFGERSSRSESAAYAAREAAFAIAFSAKTHNEVLTHTATWAGHAANYAAAAALHPRREHLWQRELLIRLILQWDGDEWMTAVEGKPSCNVGRPGGSRPSSSA